MSCLCHRHEASVPRWLGKTGIPEHQEPSAMWLLSMAWAQRRMRAFWDLRGPASNSLIFTDAYLLGSTSLQKQRSCIQTQHPSKGGEGWIVIIACFQLILKSLSVLHPMLPRWVLWILHSWLFICIWMSLPRAFSSHSDSWILPWAMLSFS